MGLVATPTGGPGGGVWKKLGVGGPDGGIGGPAGGMEGPVGTDGGPRKGPAGECTDPETGAGFTGFPRKVGTAGILEIPLGSVPGDIAGT